MIWPEQWICILRFIQKSYIFSHLLDLCVCVCARTHALCICVWMNLWRQKGWHQVSSWIAFHLIFFETGFLSQPEAGQVGSSDWPASPGIFSLSLSSTKTIGVHCIYMLGSNSGSHAYAITLTAEPSPQPLLGSLLMQKLCLRHTWTNPEMHCWIQPFLKF